MKTYILYHKSCQDGFGAAFAAWKKFGSSAQYIPVQYNEPVPELEDGSTVYIVDFAFKRPVLLELKQRMKELVVLDHHKTAKEDLEGLDFAIFDMTRSGALITWNYFHPDTEPPFLIQAISDRDLWKFKLSKTREISMALFSHPYDFALWDKFLNQKEELIHDGTVLLRQQETLLKVMLRKQEVLKIDEFSVPAIFTPVLGSEACEELEKAHPTAPFCVYYSRGDGNLYISLRCNHGGTDVSAIAARFGGGGHRAAAAFVVPDTLSLTLTSPPKTPAEEMG